MPVDEVFTPDLLPRVRGWQRQAGQPVTGTIDEPLLAWLGVPI